MSAVDEKDVQQGQLGDCFFAASLWAVARTPGGRAMLQSAIKENRDDRGAVASYTVTLHRPETHWGGLGRTTFTEVRVTVDGGFVTDHHAVARPNGDTNEIWPLVLEKAYAQYVGGYPIIDQGGWASDPMQVLTGREAAHVELWRFAGLRVYSGADLQRDLAAHRPIVLGTWPETQGYDLVPSHAYAVTGTKMVDGELYVTLHNPWDKVQPHDVPVAELDRYFHAAYVGSVP